MALKDVVVLNTTSSRLEVLQSSDTLRISSSASTPFEVQNSSTSVFKVDNSAKAINVTGDVTASLDISASLVSSASFGRVEATTLVGSGAGLSNTQAEGLLSSSAQIASDISGSSKSGFEFTGNLTGSNLTARFGRLKVDTLAITGSVRSYNITKTLWTPDTGGRNSTFPQRQARDCLVFTDDVPPLVQGGISASFASGFEWENKLGRYGIWKTGPTSAIAGCSYMSTVGNCNDLKKIGENSAGNAGEVCDWNGVSFSDGTELNHSRWAGTATGGSTNSLLAIGGCMASASSQLTEHWNGSAWSNGGNLIASGDCVKQFTTSTGTENAALFGVDYVANSGNVEEYNGSSWSSGGILLRSLSHRSFIGTQNDAMSFGGYSANHGGGRESSDINAYDGTSWTKCGMAVIGNMGKQRWFGSANLAVQGLRTNCSTYYSIPQYCSDVRITGTQIWNGITTTMDMPRPFTKYCSATSRGAATGDSTGDNGMVVDDGGNVHFWELVGAASFNTASFSQLNIKNLRNARAYNDYRRYEFGQVNDGKTFSNVQVNDYYGGYSPHLCGSTGAASNPGESTSIFNSPNVANYSCKGKDLVEVEESLQIPIYASNPVTSSCGEAWFNSTDKKFYLSYGQAWRMAATHAGGYANASYSSQCRVLQCHGGAGTSNASLIWGGYNAPQTRNGTTEYNGSSWSAGNTTPTAVRGQGSTGTQNAAVGVGGVTPSAGIPTMMCYDGTNWSTGTDFPLDCIYDLPSMAGTQNDFFLVNGLRPKTAPATGLCYLETTYLWNGSAWSTGNSINNSGYTSGGAGTSNAGIAGPGNQRVNCTEEWDGTSWTNGGAHINCTKVGNIEGTQNDAYSIGGCEVNQYASGNAAGYIARYQSFHYNGTSWGASHNMVHPLRYGGTGDVWATAEGMHSIFDKDLKTICFG